MQLQAYLLTLLLELPVALALACVWGLPLPRASLATLLASSLTHPLAWQTALILVTMRLWWLVWLLVEAGVVLVEALVFGWVLRVPWRRALWLSFLVNAVSASAGWLWSVF